MSSIMDSKTEDSYLVNANKELVESKMIKKSKNSKNSKNRAKKESLKSVLNIFDSSKRSSIIIELEVKII